MRVTRRPLFRAVTVGALLALAATACGSGGSGGGKNTASAPGVTATSILLGSHQPLTGPAAPGYSEIAPAAQAYFDYVNAKGGVHNRKITLKYLDDAYNPSNTSTVVRQLVLQDKVFAIMGGLGTPTHSAVVDFLNQQRVPDLFVASGCACWNEPQKHPWTFGWQLDYVRSGKILGQYIKQNFPGKKVAIFYQNDDFGQDGVKGISSQVPASQIVTKQSYTPGDLNIGPAVSAIAASKADVVVLYTVPAYTALFKLFTLRVGYNPQLVVNDVGSDPQTLIGLMESFAKQGGATVDGKQLIEGMVTDMYAPSVGDLSNDWISLFKKIHDQYDAKAPFDGNVLYGMMMAYTMVNALQHAGKNLTRADVVKVIENGDLNDTRPAFTPYAYSSSDHFGMTGAQIGVIKNGIVVGQGPIYTTTDSVSSPIKTYSGSVTKPAKDGIPGS